VTIGRLIRVLGSEVMFNDDDVPGADLVWVEFLERDLIGN
jgi:hypothetical protein